MSDETIIKDYTDEYLDAATQHAAAAEISLVVVGSPQPATGTPLSAYQIRANDPNDPTSAPGIPIADAGGSVGVILYPIEPPPQN